jgi:hypothetical protein
MTILEFYRKGLMNHNKKIPQIIVEMLVSLLLVSCGVLQPSPTPTPIPPTTTPTKAPTATPTPQPGISGILVDADTDEPLVDALVMLCQKESIGDCNCEIKSNLSAHTDEKGSYSIPFQEMGEYGVLYNTSGEMKNEWDGMQVYFCSYDPPVDFSKPMLGTSFKETLRLFWESMGAGTLSSCFYLIDGDGETSTYLFFRKQDLGVIWNHGQPYSVEMDKAHVELNLAVWNPEKESCGEQWKPLR